jgi:spermine/spermidine synthase
VSKTRLVALSFLMLFVELALIRWTGSNVVYLSYFSNFVLFASFLGIGIGFLRSRSKVDLFPWAGVLLAAFVALVLLFPVTINRIHSAVVFYAMATSGPPIWFFLPAIFVMVSAIMSAIAQGVARAFASFKPLEAYRLDIIGSILGIGAFALLSFWGAPPVVWGAIVSVVLLALYGRQLRLVQVVAALALFGALGTESAKPAYVWSPYYKLAVRQFSHGVIGIEANGIPHQTIAPISHYSEQALYFVPYKRRTSTRLDRVLIVGAGNGIDAAIALKRGAKHVDAVEIDPRIYQIGRQLNPDRPYRDARISVHINDGRAYLVRDRNDYDLILFALPDSLTLISGQSSLRLESYLFTVEAFASARTHLKPRGVFATYNIYRERWLVDRLAQTLKVVYGHAPCVDFGSFHGAVLTVGLRPNDVVCPTVWRPSDVVASTPASDDRPFLYLKTPGIPSFYLVTLAFIVLISLLTIRLSGGPFGQMRPYADLFFMGAAFLLLETKSVVQFALLFGSTWFVNALVFFGVLVAVYGAIEVARRRRIRRPAIAYGALFTSLAVAWAVEPSRLLPLDAPVRLAAAIALAFGPIFLANVIFADRFRASASSTVAFGTNLLGAMLGGILEYSSLVLGYRNLLLVVALLYAFAFVLTPRDTQTVKDPLWARQG